MTISPCFQTNRPKPWGARWRDDDGKRRFKFFASEKERDRYITEARKKVAREGSALLDLSAADAVTMRKCLDLVGDPATVLQACQEWADKGKVIPVKVSKAVEEYQAEKEAVGRDENYQRAKRAHFDRLKTFMPDEFAIWTAQDARQWTLMLSDTFAPVTVENHVRTAIGFSRWCIRRGYMLENPFSDVPVPDVIRPEPEFLPVASVKDLLTTARDKYPDAVAYFALGAFAGLRSSVCARLPVEAIHIKQRGILIPASHAKNKRRVYTDGYPDNLWAWLEWAEKNSPEGFNLSKRMWDRRRGQVAKKAGVKMPHNALRHSFCTYHVAMEGDAGKTATLLTHRGNVAILYEHYRGNATREEGEAYFGIRP
jgi:integrase